MTNNIILQQLLAEKAQQVIDLLERERLNKIDQRVIKDISYLIRKQRKSPNVESANILLDLLMEDNPIFMNADERTIRNLLCDEYGVFINEGVEYAIKHHPSRTIWIDSNGRVISKPINLKTKLRIINL